MAAVSASAVTILEVQYNKGASGRRQRTVRATVVLSSQGDDTDYIPTSLFKLNAAKEVSAFVKSDNSAVYPGAPSYDGSKIYVVDSHAPATVTGTFRVSVTGTY